MTREDTPALPASAARNGRDAVLYGMARSRRDAVPYGRPMPILPTGEIFLSHLLDRACHI